MKLTRFGQSCVLIETKEKRILIDPGVLKYEASLLEEHWKDIDILLVTHKHGDHFNVNAIKDILKDLKTKFYSTQEVANASAEVSPKIIKEGDVLEFEEVKVNIVKAVHGYLPHLKGGREIYENVGYIIDDGEHKVYATSDTLCFDNDYKCDVLFVPVCNHGLVMGPFEAAFFAKDIGAKLVIPYHYDNLDYPVDLGVVKKEFEKRELNYKILDIGESITI